MDPSKIILKLCQVCFKASHKFVTQDQGNKKTRKVEFQLNSQKLINFEFECANNKIANKATAYETLSILFPGIFFQILYNLMATTDGYVFAEFLCKRSSYKKKEEKEKKENK